jgi:protein-disulfide isomerase
MGRFSRRLLSVLAVASLGLAACQKGAGPAVNADEMSLGNAQAKVTVIEYASASCPHCAAFNNDVFPAFKAKYIDTGQVHYIFREFLTNPVPFAAAGFLTARCAGKDKYFSVLDAIFKGQDAIYQSGDMRGGLLRIAQSAGMSEKQFNDCISNPDALKALNDRFEKAQTVDHIDSTPSFVINGKLVEGEQGLAQLDAAIKSASGG